MKLLQKVEELDIKSKSEAIEIAEDAADKSAEKEPLQHQKVNLNAKENYFQKELIGNVYKDKK